MGRRTRRHVTRLAMGAALIVLAVSAQSAAAAVVHTPARFDSARARAIGRTLQEAVHTGDTGRLWRAFAPEMRQSMGDSIGFVREFESVRERTGALQRCLTEVIECRTELVLYRAGCVFSKSDAPLVLQFAFNRSGEVAGFFVRPQVAAHESKFLQYQTKTRLQLPVLGEWTVYWGGRTVEQNYHASSDDQRFAYDLLITRDCVSYSGDPTRLQSYFSWEKPIVAPAASKIVWVSNNIKDNKPGTMITIDPFGNGVVIDHGNGEFSAMAHMKQGSVRVKVGQLVVAGDTIGLCGNSGRTSEPHLHYHLQNGPEPLKGYGLPAQFVRYFSNGQPVARGEPTKGERIRRAQ